VKYYPVFLNLKDKKTALVGGGRVAERKARTLIKAGATVKIISPSLTRNLKTFSEKGKLSHIKRSYKRRDVNKAFHVIAATSSPQTNTKVAHDAEFLINVTDKPSEGNFIAPSIVRSGPLTIAISTEGASPAISKAIRKELEKLYCKEFALYLKFVESIRKTAIKTIADHKKRERFLKSLASEEIFRYLRSKGFTAVSKKISAALESEMQG
jgi:precorrin-2 dehydrogenase/sirohydrochlorin ferrochelatase